MSGEPSIAEARAELRDRYGVTDFSDCLEASDLRRKLAEARATLPVTHGLRYGRLATVGNTRDPTGVVTLSHGLGDSCDGWEDAAQDLSRRLPHLLFLVPTAPQRAVTINGGQRCNAWYDIYSMIGEGLRSGRQDGAGVLQSAEYVASLAATTAARHGVDPSRVVFAGFSQGAAVSLAAALTAPVAPAGAAILSGYLAGSAEVLPAARNTRVPLAMFHGRQDPVVPIAAARETKRVLEEELRVSPPVEFREYNMQHSAVPQEINDIADFLARVLPA